MTKFSNKSWSYTTGVVLLWLSILVMTLFVAWFSFESIFIAHIFQKLDQNALILVLVELVMFVAGVYLLILLPVKNIAYKAFLTFDDKGVELQYIDYRFQLQNEKWKWKEIEDVSEKIGNTEYELSINTKNTRVKLPLEIYQNSIRVNGIKKALKGYNVSTNYSNSAKLILLITDAIIGFALVFVLLYLLYFTLNQFL